MADLKITDLTIDVLKKHAPELVASILEEKDASQIQEDLNKEKAKTAELTGTLETMNTTVEELKDKVKELETKIEELQKENDDLKKENDDFKVAKADSDKRELVAQKLSEADLPEHLVTDLFKERLAKLNDEEMDRDIEERKQIAEKTKSKGEVKESGDERPADNGDDEGVTDEKKKKVMEAFGK